MCKSYHFTTKIIKMAFSEFNSYIFKCIHSQKFTKCQKTLLKSVQYYMHQFSIHGQKRFPLLPLEGTKVFTHASATSHWLVRH
uniref:Uncharacterized protein n=1 Tax=Anguilla anguilla TaxID=7936 RepID=A0A0E9WH83_ANGAN